MKYFTLCSLLVLTFPLFAAHSNQSPVDRLKAITKEVNNKNEELQKYNSKLNLLVEQLENLPENSCRRVPLEEQLGTTLKDGNAIQQQANALSKKLDEALSDYRVHKAKK